MEDYLGCSCNYNFRIDVGFQFDGIIPIGSIQFLLIGEAFSIWVLKDLCLYFFSGY